MAEMKKLTKKQVITSVIALALIGLVAWTIWGNTALEINTYKIVSDRIPQGFSDFRIAQVSDLHNAEFGKGNEKLITMLYQTDPDIIVITGDLIDSRHTDTEIALEFCESAIKIAPVYYVSGNHEARVAEYTELKSDLIAAGVVVLENEKVEITQEEERITLIGLDDPSFRVDYLFGDAASVSASALSELQNTHDGYTVLLAHRSEQFNIYVESGIDLVFSGHAHGGQFRFLLIGGLFAPNQGFFPEYDAGFFSKENTTMIVSRGVGNSMIPLRFNNRPEIVLAQLQTSE